MLHLSPRTELCLLPWRGYHRRMNSWWECLSCNTLNSGPAVTCVACGEPPTDPAGASNSGQSGSAAVPTTSAAYPGAPYGIQETRFGSAPPPLTYVYSGNPWLPPMPVTPVAVPTLPSTEPLAVAAFVVGLFALLTCGLLSPVAIALGVAALSKIERSPVPREGRWMAGIGIAAGILSLLGIAFTVIIFVRQ